MGNDKDDLKFSILTETLDDHHTNDFYFGHTLHQHYPLEKVYRPQCANYRRMEIV